MHPSITATLRSVSCMAQTGRRRLLIPRNHKMVDRRRRNDKQHLIHAVITNLD